MLQTTQKTVHQRIFEKMTPMKEEHYLLLERYFLGEMNEKEEIDLLERLKADSELAADFGVYRKMHRAMRQLRFEELEAQSKKLPPLHSPIFPLNARTSAMAASLGFLFFALGLAYYAFFYARATPHYSFEQAPPLSVLDLNNRNVAPSPTADTLRKLYRQKDFAGIVRFFEPPTHTETEAERFLWAVSAYQSQRYPLADSLWQTLRHTEHPALSPQVTLFRAATLWRLGRQQAAKETVRPLLQQGNFKAKATELLEAMKE